MTIRTHKMVRDAGDLDLAVLQQSTSLAPYVKNFWDASNSSTTTPVFISAFASSTATPITASETLTGASSTNTGTVVDIKVTSGSWAGGDAQGWFTWTYADVANKFTALETLNASGGGSLLVVAIGDAALLDRSSTDAHLGVGLTYASNPTNGMKMAEITAKAPAAGTIWSPGSVDCGVIVVIEADSDLTRSNFILGRFGTAGEDHIFIDATKAYISNGNTTITTSSSNSPEVGSQYVVGAIVNRATNQLEHWVNGERIGVVDIPSAFATINISNYYGIGYVVGSETPQNYYGFLNCGFENGIPSDIGDYMLELKPALLAATKVLPARFVSLT